MANMNRVATYLEPEDILLDADIAGKENLFDSIDRHMTTRHALRSGEIAAGLRRRELIGTTGLGEGVAIPHARVGKLDRILVAYLRLKTPIPYDAPDGRPVSDVLVLLVPLQATEEHLQVLADATQYLADREFRARLRASAQAGEVKQLFASRIFSL
jgi:PTS system nitrogen regulatory IIA component